MTTPESNTAPTAAQLDAKVANLSYEEARAKLVEIVSRLEQGNIPLEESITLWELGEALARRCESWLDGARQRLAKAQHESTAQRKSATPQSKATSQSNEYSSPDLQRINHDSSSSLPDTSVAESGTEE